jgi:pSer/pThr/pTyr-binding forkhead associated (FHA) protein
MEIENMPTIHTRYKNKGLHEYSVRYGLSLSIGRLPDNDIVIDNDAVSGKHARIVSNGDEYYVEDLNSTNGTFVNNKRIRSRKLKDEDIIVIGKHDLIFEMTEDGYGNGIGSPEFSNGMTSRDKTSKLDSSEYKKMMAQNVYDANKATLLILKFKGQQIRKYILKPDKELMIGRLGGNDIVFENDAVSGRHAKIYAQDDEYFIQDLNSTNGTLVNKNQIKSHSLKDEDIIAIGKHELIYCQYETYTLEETLLPHDTGVDYSTDGTRAVNISKLKQSALQAGEASDGDMPHDDQGTFLSFVKGGEGDMLIENKGIKIGKDPDADILLKGFMVGNITVMITKTGTGYYLSYQGKKRGAKVNGKTVEGPTKLMDSDSIEIGSIKLVFHNR